MKLEKQKILLTLTAFLVTACGSGGSGDSSKNSSTLTIPTKSGPNKDNTEVPSGGSPTLVIPTKPKFDKGDVEVFSKNLLITSITGQGLTTTTKNIQNTGTINTTQPVDENLNIVPLLAQNGLTAINSGNITGKNISNDNIIYGMKGINGGNLENSGNINLTGHNIIGISVDKSRTKAEKVFATNSGDINLKINSDFETNIRNKRFNITLVGMDGNGDSNGSFVLNNSGKINIDALAFKNTVSQEKNIDFFNISGINLKTTKENDNTHTIINNGEINIRVHGSIPSDEDIYTYEGRSGVGISTLGKNINIINNKKIDISGIGSIGIIVSGKQSSAFNNGNISTFGDLSTGISIKEDGIGINEIKGIINVNGEHRSSGMQATGELAQVINKGEININGANAAGIRVSNYAKGLNDATGVITVGDSAYGMYASSGGIIENNGKIILSGKTNGSTGMYSIGKDSSIINNGEIILQNELDGDLAINAESGKYINSGRIIGKNSIEITGDKLGSFVVGVKENGDVGIVRANKIKLNGKITASKNLIKNNNKNILYKNIFVASKIA